MTTPGDFLECQTCGGVIRRLTLLEKTQVAENPYNYIFFCGPCGRQERQNLLDEWNEL